MKHRLAWLGVPSVSLLVLFVTGCLGPGPARAVLVASPAEGPVPLFVQFDMARSSYGSGGSGSFVLDFGDGTNTIAGEDLGTALTHVYGSPGTHTAHLTLVSAEVVTAQVTITVGTSPGELPEGASVGMRAYDFAATTTQGDEVSLSGLRGNIVLIEFWGSWCIPCKTSMPHINSLWEAYHEQGLIVLAVSTDSRKEDPVAYLEEKGYTGLTCIWEPGGKSTRIKQLFEVDWIPRSIIVDRAGIVRYNGHPMDLTAGFVEALLAETSVATESKSMPGRRDSLEADATGTATHETRSDGQS